MALSSSELLEVKKQAKLLRVPWWNLAAVVQVESNGVTGADVPVEAGGSKRLPLIRYEGHYVFRRLSGPARDAAVKAGLANSKAGGVKNPTSQAARYAMIRRCVALCKTHGQSLDIAYESCSWGIGQVMGAHWKALGYRSCSAFVADVCSGFAGQLRVMVSFITVNSADDELRDSRYSAFGRIYNGPAYRKNKYDTKLQRAAESFKRTDASQDTGEIEVPASGGVLRVGSSGRRVRELQNLLITAGFTIKADSDFGPATRDAVKAFQTQVGIQADGIYGPQTEAALAAYRPADPAKIPGSLAVGDVQKVKTAIVGGGGTVAGVVAVKEAFQEGIDKLVPYADLLPWVGNVQAALAVGATVAGLVAVGYGIYGWWESKQTVEV